MTQSSATQRGSDPADTQFITDRTHPGRWTITFSNPPINMFVPATIIELGTLITDLEADQSVKVVDPRLRDSHAGTLSRLIEQDSLTALLWRRQKNLLAIVHNLTSPHRSTNPKCKRRTP
jgi:hypothetical protein